MSGSRRLILITIATLAAVACTSRTSPPAGSSSASATNSPSVHQIGVAARRDGDIFVCETTGARLAVFYGTAYPVGSRDLSLRPTGCFSSAAQARAAAIEVATPAPSVRTVDGVSLGSPIGMLVTTLCSQAAHAFKFRIECPTLVPSDWVGLPLTGGCWARCQIFALEGSFKEPPHQGVGGTTTGHLIVWATKPVNLRRGFIGCTEGSKVGSTMVGAAPATWVTCPPGDSPDSGHVVLEWRQAGIVYAVSIHHDNPINRQLAIAVASNLRPMTT